ncbi:plastocyanin/azurin family copper-binding protein [Singulisphaera sp. Ch08]|uniref:Plastocyanin/azurin family copper-binding protein n=1 Tax=Singulisphaera sp. Ch08 TaxID=3120278 RepID=A0AAU7C7X2_9BACT
MTGWGTYTPADGSFQRVRYTGDPVQLPVELHARENGLLVTFSGPVDRAVAETPRSQFAQAWNYRYGPGYGSQEFSPHHPSMPGHDPLTIRSVTLLEDERTLFLEIPDLQPVNQLHLHLRVDASRPVDLFATVHKLAAPFTGFAGYRPVSKVVAAHPILSDLALATHSKPNPWRKKLPNAQPITLEAGKNLTFTPSSFEVPAGATVELTFKNPDVVPHNWALIRPDSLPRVGDLINKIIAEPDAVARHYIPKSDDVLVYSDMVPPQDQFTISFQAPAEKGRYPYVCTFPGHWMVMNGVMIVK